ncbi:carboxylesterase 1E-like isoform X2 [Lineus longissimus]|uniref:carboxylesterase 1E-like isoform X2 n=1 Tax=Lineus longissimus TaxID=88925 RepID=UPI002B4E2895
MMIWRFVYFTLAASCIHCLVTSPMPTDDVIVKTPLGKIRGRRRTDKIDSIDLGATKVEIGIGIDTVDIFLGIPFAEPPLGDRRFSPPKSKTAWGGTRNATVLPPVCPQTVNTTASGDEDCLYLNVYSPFQANDSSASYPVMVYIHGGSYIAGTANDYTGHILARHGVVVVIINYRLGVFGFLTTGDDDLPGNYGIQDQTMALKWTADNIRAFRGNPQQVTIFGNSAGGSSVGIHLLSPPSAGLFHRAIIQSGPITNSLWAHHRTTPAVLRNHAMTIARRSNCTQKSFGDVIQCMRKITWKELLAVEVPRLYGTPERLIPVVDGNVLPGLVDDLLKDANKVHNVPVLIGMTKDECAPLLGYIVAPKLRKDVDLNTGFNDTQFKQSVNYLLSERYSLSNNTYVLDDARFEYTDHERSSTVDIRLSNRYQLVQLCTDVQITAPTIYLAQALRNLNLPVYMYVFDHAANATDIPPYIASRSYHQSELPFVFGGPYFRPTDPHFPAKITYKKHDITFSVVMMQWWTNFAKSGNPTPNGREKDWINWSRYLGNGSEYLFIGPDGWTIYKYYKAHRVAFWNDFVPTLKVKVGESISMNFENERKELQIKLIAVAVNCGLLGSVVVVLSIVVFTNRRRTKWKLKQMNNESTVNLSVRMPEETNSGYSRY